MFLHCNCGEKLTTDLFPTNKWILITKSYHHEGTVRLPRGSFYKFKHNFYVDKCMNTGYSVNPVNVDKDIIPQFRSGMGCCNLAWQPVYCKVCEKEIGMANLDCYQDESIDFFERSVYRSYKK